MNRTQFGQLVAALRKERIDEQEAKFWTQAKLAQEAGLSEVIIGNIERGRRMILEPEVLLSLAQALELTSGERKEFFAAAVGMSLQQARGELNDSHQQLTLNKLLQHLSQTYLPAYVIDAYSDMIAANAALIQLLELTPAYLERASQQPAGFNLLHFVFAPEFVKHHQKLMGERWHAYACQSMLIFRMLTLRYRVTPYFRYLTAKLRRYPFFRSYWHLAYLEEKDQESGNECIQLNSPRWGLLTYFSTLSPMLTGSGELYFCVYVPTTLQTTQIFTNIVQEAGSIAQPLASWPEKRAPGK